MELKELEAVFQGTKILLVEVEDIDDETGTHALRVAGDLAAFTSTVSKLGIPVVFLTLDKLDASAFVYRQQNEDLSTTTEERYLEIETPEEDLCAANQALASYKRYIGSIGRIWLYAPTDHFQLTYVIEDPWFTEFLECSEAAITLINQQLHESEATLEQLENDRLSELTKRLNNLVNDKKFAGLPTQKAMLEYAKINISGLDQVDKSFLKEAISSLYAKIIAQSALCVENGNAK